jgi:meso-butanediol dehydrogenase/(S,S)-butanediol dehydrogenase/diacetyl reductase
LDQKLSGKVCVITGASRGIGAGIAAKFIRDGATVISVSRSRGQLPSGAAWIDTDVSDPANVNATFQQVLASHGRLDVLVNNAGIQRELTVPETSDADWAALSGTNMAGVFYCCRAGIPIMAARGGGSIINIGSISARHADWGLAVYNATKAFVHGLTRSIAIDHGQDGIRCNAVAPGWIMTGMANSAFAQAPNPQAALHDTVQRHPAGRMGTPADIAGMVAWLAGPEAVFATGQIFVIDGGLTAASPIKQLRGH